MNTKLLTCTMCGETFDPATHTACQSCPLQKGCSLVCCPRCGFEMVDVSQSRLVRLVSRWLPGTSGSLLTSRLEKDSLPADQIVERRTGP
jgi:hypothetical protein